MNIRCALERAEEFLRAGDIENTEWHVFYADNYLKAADPDGTLESPRICCFWAEGNIIHCGRTPDGPLFPGTREERYKLCKDCWTWCREKIKELELAVKEKKKKSKNI